MFYLCGVDRDSEEVLAADPGSKKIRINGRLQPVISSKDNESLKRYLPSTSGGSFVVVEGIGPFRVTNFLSSTHESPRL